MFVRCGHQEDCVVDLFMALNKPISVFERLIGVLVSKLLKFSKLPNRTIRRQELRGRGDPNLRSQAC